MTIWDALTTLENTFKEHANPECVKITVSITYEGLKVSYDNRSAESLKRDGVSMRNLRGEWIKDTPPQT